MTDDSPFRQGAERRALGLTIHAPASASLTTTDSEALAFLRELVSLSEFECADTAFESPFHLKVDPLARGVEGTCPFEVSAPESHLKSLILHPDRWVEVGERLTTEYDLQLSPYEMFVGAAHQSLEHDLLVTTSPELLRTRATRELRHWNIVTPLEALKLAGLFLRARNQFVYFAPQGARISVDPWMFYILLTRATLARVRRSRGRWPGTTDPEIGQLRESVSSRCRRAIEARDAIGVQFYLRESNRTQDVILYHFDYLTLLLGGALDAILRVAKRVYAIECDDSDVGLWRKGFRKQLSASAPRLYGILNSERGKALRDLLTAPRNTIHSVRLGSMSYRLEDTPEIALIKFGDVYGHSAWKAAGTLGGGDRWGFVLGPGFSFEPYSYTLALLEETFGLLGELSDEMQDHLLAASGEMPEPEGAPPALFGPEVLRRIELLG